MRSETGKKKEGNVFQAGKYDWHMLIFSFITGGYAYKRYAYEK